MSNYDFRTDNNHYDTFVIYGRFQPFHRGHLEMVKMLYAIALDYTTMENMEIIIGMSSSDNDERNPLSASDRKEIIINSLPKYIKPFVRFIESKDPWEFSKNFKGQNVIWICGDDQYKDYLRLANNLAEDQPKNIAVHNYGPRTQSGDDFRSQPSISKISATAIRKASVDNDLVYISQTLSPELNEQQVFEVAHKLAGRFSNNLVKFKTKREPSKSFSDSGYF